MTLTSLMIVTSKTTRLWLYQNDTTSTHSFQQTKIQTDDLISKVNEIQDNLRDADLPASIDINTIMKNTTNNISNIENDVSHREINKRINELEQQVKQNNIKLPVVNGPQSTVGMNVTQSAKVYNIDPTEISSVQKLMENRNIESRFDATKFKDDQMGAIWTKDENGKRSVMFNPNASADTIIENIAIHEMVHDLMSSSNSKVELDTSKLLNYVRTLDGYNEARQSLIETYSKEYDKNSSNFESLIDEEAVADVLGRKLGNQEFINRLVNQNQSIAKKIYNWVLNKVDSLINSNGKVRNERIFWENIKNKFEKAYNMEYNNSTNEASTKYATVTNNPYGHTKEFVKMTQRQQEEIHRVVSPLATKYAGVAESYSTHDINGNKVVFDIFEDATYRITSVEKTKDIIKEVANETNPNTNSKHSMASSEQQSGYSGNNNESNRNRGTGEQTVKIPTREQIRSQDRVSNKTQGRNNKELDSSFSYRGSHQIENAKAITKLNVNDIQSKIIEVDGYLTKQAESDFKKLKKILTSPDEKVIVYRAAPVNELNSGDWITTDKSYAQNVANSNGGKVYTFQVNANELYYPDNVRELPSLHRLSSFQYVNNNLINQQETKLPKQNKGNIPINKELFLKYNDYKEIFNGERNNYDGNIEVNADISDILKDYNLSDMTSSKEAAIKIFNMFHGDNLFNNNGNKIEVSKSGIRESVQKIFENNEQRNLIEEHMQVFSDLGDIIEHADLVSQANNTKPEEHPGVNSWNYYFDGLNIKGNKYSLEFEVRSIDNGNNQYRVQRLEPKEKTTNSSGVASNDTRNLPPYELAVSIKDNTTNQQKSQIAPLSTNSNMQNNEKNTNENFEEEISTEKLAEILDSKPQTKK